MRISFIGLITILSWAIFAALIALWARPPLGSDGPIFDLMIATRSFFFEPPNVQSKVSVLALDLRSSKSPELAKYPGVLLRPIWGKVVDLLVRSGTKVIGFDVVFDDDLSHVPGLSANFDEPLVEAVERHRDKIVLGSAKSALPFPRLLEAAGSDDIAALYIPRDSDGRTRRVEREFWRDGEFVPSLYAALLNRVGGAPVLPRELFLAPRRQLETIPSYSLIDVLRCSNDTAALASAFKSKIVLVGVVNPGEDRIEYDGRFLRADRQYSAPLAPCGLHRLGRSDPRSETVPGVFISAGAVDEVLSGDVTTTVPAGVVAVGASVSSAIAIFCALILNPVLGITAAFLMDLVIFGCGTVALNHDYCVPILIPMLGASIAPVVGYSMRYVVEERTRRRLQRAFNHYVHPILVSRLAEDPRALKLGGERREITIMFADLSGFTAMSTRLEPEALTTIVNRYFNYIVPPIDETTGFVERFVGDAVVGMWGAPVSDPNHAIDAVRAAMEIIQRVQFARQQDEARGLEGFTIKIGINSGWATVGNIGGINRYSYTAMGEQVNLAARLESIPPLYGCAIVVGERTAELVGRRFLMCELDWILPKGAARRLAIYQPIIELEKATKDQKEWIKCYQHALVHYRARRFVEASVIWDKIVVNFGLGLSPASIMGDRARILAAEILDSEWTGVNILHEK